MGGIRVAQAPPRSALLEQAASGPLIEVPLGNRDSALAAMYRSIYHAQPVGNGHSGYLAPHYPALAYGLAALDDEVLSLLPAMGIGEVFVRRGEDAEGAFAAFVSSHADTERIAEDETGTLYRLPARAGTPTAVPYGRRLAIADLATNVNPDRLSSALDGDRASRWHSGPQRDDHWLQIDMGAAQEVGAVRLELGPYLHDFPRHLRVDLSVDGQAWIEAWRGTGASVALAAALQNPHDVPITIPLGGRRARFVRLSQIGSDPVFYWSISELAVHGPVDLLSR
jgi:hypothetical protein